MLLTHMIEQLAAPACAAESGMPQYTPEQRGAAVDAFSRAHCNYAKAADLLMQENLTWLPRTRRALKKFIRDNVSKFEKTKSTANQYKGRPPPNPKKLPDSVALECAAILKQGYKKTVTLTFGWRTRAGRREEVREYMEYYNSIHEACQMEPQLNKVLDQYGIDAAHLLRRMHEVDKSLVLRRRDFKRALSEEQRAERMACAKRNLAQYEAEDIAFVRRVVWIDEFGMWMVPKKSRKSVYCDDPCCTGLLRHASRTDAAVRVTLYSQM